MSGGRSRGDVRVKKGLVVPAALPDWIKDVDVWDNIDDGTPWAVTETTFVYFNAISALLFILLGTLLLILTSATTRPNVRLTWLHHHDMNIDRGFVLPLGITVVLLVYMKGLWHLAYASYFRQGLALMLKNNYNYYRWVEYSTTWVLIIVISSIVCGIRNFVLIFLLMLLTISMLIISLSAERSKNTMLLVPLLVIFIGISACLGFSLATSPDYDHELPPIAWIYMPTMTLFQFTAGIILFLSLHRPPPHSIRIELLYGLVSNISLLFVIGILYVSFSKEDE